MSVDQIASVNSTPPAAPAPPPAAPSPTSSAVASTMPVTPPAINPPVAPLPDPTIKAAIVINDGSKIPFRFVDDPALPPLQRLQARFNALIEFSKSYRPEVIRELTFFDKSLHALYQLNTLIENDLGTEQIAELDSYIERNVRSLPEYPYVEIILIRTLFSKQKISEAEADQRFQNLISKYRGSEQIWLSYVQFLTENNRPNPAIAIFCKYLKTRHPELNQLNRADLINKAVEVIDRWDHLSILGDLLFNQGDASGSLSILKQAETCFRKALALARHPAQKLLLQQKLGNIYLVLAGMTGEKEYAEKAIPCFQELLQREPQNPIYLTWMGDSYQLLSEITDEDEPAQNAKAYYRQALEVPDRPPEIALHLADIYLRENKPEAAVALIEKEVKAHPNVPALMIYLADLYAAAGQFDKALAGVKKAFEIARSDPALLCQTYAQFERSRFGLKVKLAQMQARVPGNPAGAVFSALGRALSMANPLNTVIAIATGNVPHYTQEELEDYLSELERVRDQVYDHFQQDHSAIDFYLLNLDLFAEIKNVIAAERDKASRALGGTEYEASMLELEEECATEQDRNLEWMKTFLNTRTEDATEEQLVSLLRARFANFTKLSLLIEQGSVDPGRLEEL